MSTQPRGMQVRSALVRFVFAIAVGGCFWTSSSTTAQRPVTGTGVVGQSLTLLPDGRWLWLGGMDTDGQSVGSAIVREVAGAENPAPWRLAEPRAWHTTTVLPDGRIVVVGGVTTTGQPARSAELIDPVTGLAESIDVAPALRRSRHTATLLIDGRVIVVGGIDTQGAWADTVSWTVETGGTPSWNAPIGSRRYGHAATLGAEGDVWVTGGVRSDGAPASTLDRYVVDAQRVSLNARRTPDADVTVAASVPANGAVGVPPATRIAVRFAAPVDVETLNPSTVSLSGPDGVVRAFIVGAETGRLLFVTPWSSLEPGSEYTLTMDGARDTTGVLIVPQSIRFSTAGERPPRPTSSDSEDGDESARQSPWRTLPPLDAPANETALAGQVLRLNGQPLADVTLSIGRWRTYTDRTGRFVLTRLSEGHQELVIDGATANRAGATYGRFEVGVDLIADKRSVLPYTIWMPRLDTAHAVRIPSPTVAETVVTTPRLPGLELRLPAGTVIEDDDHQVVRDITITPVPIDRPPFPLPDVRVPIYFTIQPGGAYLRMPSGTRARLIYPNPGGAPVGTSFDFWNYDAEGRGWYVYGQGAVVPPGQQIAPNPGVGIYSFSGAMVANPNFAPALGPAPGGAATDGDPVDLATGLFVMRKTDVVLPDIVPIQLERTYRQNDARSRAFGIGMTHAYDIFLVGDQNPYTYAEVILPDGGRVRYTRISAGTGFADAVYEHTTTPTGFYKSRLAFVPSLSAVGITVDASFPFPSGWELTLKDGRRWYFSDSETASTPAGAGLVGVRDRFGNLLTVFRHFTKGATKISTPNGRFVQFTYDTSNRITQAVDNVGRVTAYAYDTNGRLITVTDPDGGTTQYTYDASHRMLTLKDRRGLVYLTNAYDAAGRVTQQTQADGTTYKFSYTVDISGNVIQTDVTDPGGRVRRVLFSPTKYATSDTRALGRPEAQTVTYARQAGTNMATTVTDPIGRQTVYAYDTLGNLASMQQLAATPDAVTTAFTYTSAFSDLASVTDPLEHPTTYTWDSAGHLVQAVDPLGHATTFTYNAAGQVVSATSALGAVTQFGYSHGDLVSVIDPLGRVTSRTVDAAGRPVTVRDALGHETRSEYSALNQVTRVTDALGGQTTFVYDSNGNLTSLTDARGNTTTWGYDVMDRVVTQTDPLQHAETTAYGPSGTVLQTTNRKGQVTTFRYDGLDRPTLVTYADGSTTSATYDAGNRLTQIADSLGGVITRGFDGLDRLSSEATPEGASGYAYDAASRRTVMAVAGQPSVSYTYDAADRLTSMQSGNGVSFTYDLDNRRTATTLPNGMVVLSTYDAASQLTGLTYQSGATTLGTLSYTYDATGNRTSVGGTYARTGLPAPLASANYDAGNRLTQWGTTALTYDLNGNLTHDGTQGYTWNASNRLAAVGGASFVYDGVGRRRTKTVGGATTGFLYDGLNAVQELAGTMPTANLLTGGLDEVFSRTDGSGTRSLLTDALGSTIALATAIGALPTQYTYEPFGKTTTLGVADANKGQFTGRENDGTDLYYYRARYYHPTLGRFVSEDPIGLEGGDTNFYAYVRSNPVNLSDPSGLTFWSNLKFFLDWVSGSGARKRNYGPRDIETDEMRESLGAKRIRRQFYDDGCRSRSDLGYGTMRAYLETAIDPRSNNFGSTAFQVGGFDGASAVNNGNGTVTFTIRNTAGMKSFFYHAIPDRSSPTGWMSNIRQTFQWTETIVGRRKSGC